MSKVVFFGLLILTSLTLCKSAVVENLEQPITVSEMSQERSSDTEILQRFLDDTLQVKSPIGSFYINQTLIQTVDKPVNWLGTTIYTTENIDVLKVRIERPMYYNLTINTSLVKNPTPDKTLLTFQYKRRNLQHYVLRDISIIGNFEKLREKKGVGHTGVLFDSTSEAGGTLKNNIIGENHFGLIDNLYVEGLHTGLVMSNDPKYNKRRAPNGRHDIFIQGVRCKKLAVIHVGRVNLRYKYNNSHVLLEGEEDFDLVELGGSFNKIQTEFPDFNKGVKPIMRKGVKLFAHKWKVSNYGKRNVILDDNHDFGKVKAIKPFKKAN